jgi:hypothetical protein
MAKYDVMVDLETVSVRSNAAICSIGAVKFNLEDGIIDTFYEIIDANTCKKYGLHVDKDTIGWWLSQKKEVLLELTRNCKPLDTVLDSFSEWYGPKGVPTWSNGSDFDSVILENAYLAIGKVRPWKYFHNRCFRTIKEIIRIPHEQEGNLHNALDDAISQTKHLIKILRS